MLKQKLYILNFLLKQISIQINQVCLVFFVFSHNKEVGSVIVEIENNKFILSELEYKNKKVLNLIYNKLKEYNKKWKCNYEF